MCVPLMVSCSGFGLPLHAQLLRLFVTQSSRLFVINDRHMKEKSHTRAAVSECGWFRVPGVFCLQGLLLHCSLHGLFFRYIDRGAKNRITRASATPEHKDHAIQGLTTSLLR